MITVRTGVSHQFEEKIQISVNSYSNLTIEMSFLCIKMTFLGVEGLVLTLNKSKFKANFLSFSASQSLDLRAKNLSSVVVRGIFRTLAEAACMIVISRTGFELTLT
jgi:hypothetical protein